jgi:hypothetical protein
VPAIQQLRYGYWSRFVRHGRLQDVFLNLLRCYCLLIRGARFFQCFLGLPSVESAEDAQIMVLRDIGFGMERGGDEDIRVLIEVLLRMRRWRSGVNGHG